MNQNQPRIYLDHAASSPLRPQAADALVAASEVVGNPSALHTAGRRARALLEDAREQLATVVGAYPDELIFTSGGSEADAIAVLGAAAARPGLIVIGGIEHPAVAGAREVLADRVLTLPVGASGHVIPKLPTGEIALISVQGVNNEIGTVQPIDDLVAAAGDIWVHSDLVQMLGHLPIDFHASGLTLASLSAHKIGGPVGIGALLVRRGVQLPSYGLGGKQEAGIRSGTQLVALASAFAAAAAAAETQRAELGVRLTGFAEQIERQIELLNGVQVNGEAPRSAHIVNLRIDGASGEDVLFLLDQAGIDVSTGSACRAGVHGPSEILLALGQDERAASSAIRISMGWNTSQADIDALLSELPAAIERARLVPR